MPCTVALNKLLFKPPAKPRSEEIIIKPTRLMARSCRYGCLYSGCAFARWPITLRIFAAYGRAARTRSCALRILLVATISMARVIFCVLFTLLILVRISFPLAILNQFLVTSYEWRGYKWYLLATSHSLLVTALTKHYSI